MSLFSVLVLLLLSLTAVLGAFRVSNLNESILGNTSDFNRTYAAAEALIRDAEADIRGRVPPYVLQPNGNLGTPCRPDLLDPTVTAVGFLGCRNTLPLNTLPWFPVTSADIDAVGDLVAALSVNGCLNGICVPATAATLANIETMPAFANGAGGATYGQFTRNGMPLPGAAGNPILTGGQAWYWVEVFRYSESAPYSTLTPDPNLPYVYRITAIARGLKPGTQVVLKSTFVPYPKSQNP